MTTDRQLKAAAKKAADALMIVSESGKLDGSERDALGLIRMICHEIEDGDR